MRMTDEVIEGVVVDSSSTQVNGGKRGENPEECDVVGRDNGVS
jgi:hypothetical protein